MMDKISPTMTYVHSPIDNIAALCPCFMIYRQFPSPKSTTSCTRVRGIGIGM